MNLIRSSGMIYLAGILAVLFVEDVAAREPSALALAKIPPGVLERFIHQDQRELILLLDDHSIAKQAPLQKKNSELRFEDHVILKTKRNAYNSLKNELRLDFEKGEFDLLRDYTSLPMMFVRISSVQVLYQLLENDLVVRVFENKVHTISLLESLPLIGQYEGYAEGYRGQGTTVAVLDTGVDYTEKAFGRCTSPGAPGECKVIFAKDFAEDDGAADMNGHGTNVAGIVLGVAPETRIASLDVFTGVGILTADAIAAIDWVIINQALYNIVAMNLSFGTELYDHVCQDSWATTPFANARAVGVVPIVASGNNAKDAMVKNPACAPGAIRVGAVHDTKPEGLGIRECSSNPVDADVVACFSNSAAFLDFLAPGVDVTAAGLTKTGTSMAVPHVVGAYAVLKGETAYPDEGIDSTIQRLKDSGKPVQDDRNRLWFPRIDLEAALFELLPDQVPEISRFEPVMAAEGQLLQIHGGGFRGVDEVLIGNTPAYDFSVVNSELMTASVGAGSSGDVRLTTSVGSDSLPGFTFINSVRETEPNNNVTQANPVFISGERLAGDLFAQNDRDFFRFGFDSGEVTFGIRPVRSSCCSRHVQLELLDSSGNVLASERTDESMTESLSLRATIDKRGAYYLLVSATPEGDSVFEGDYQITVPDVSYTNSPPEFTSSPSEVAFKDQTYRYSLLAGDADSDSIHFSVLAAPSGMILNQQTNTLIWRPNADQTGAYDVELAVSDDFGGSDTQTFSVAVIDSSLVQINATDGAFKNHVRVTFNPVDGAVVYRVFRCLDLGESCGSPIGYSRNGLFRDIKAVPGVLYYYRVRICSTTRCGQLSAADAGFTGVAPARPTIIRASDGNFIGHVRVEFQAVDEATRYRVFRCMDRGQTCGLPIGFPVGTTYDDAGADPGIVYYYRVKACHSQLCGKFSVADAGHSASGAHAFAEIMKRGVVKPIPMLSPWGSCLLMLMVLCSAGTCGYRALQTRKLDFC